MRSNVYSLYLQEKPGGVITIHVQSKWNADGREDAYTLSQYLTQGCLAVWYAVREGVPVTIG
ncbi:MAG: hypothetical protein ACP5D3_03970 [Sulfurovum sp.]